MSDALAKYNAAKHALSVVVNIDEVKNIRDQAVAMRMYAMQAKDRALIDYATEIRLRAERRAGEMLRDMEKNKGARASGSNQHELRSHDATAPKLADLGLNKSQSSRWQDLAALNDDDFEDRITHAQQKASAAADRPQPKPKSKPKAKPEPKPKPKRGGNGAGTAAACIASIAELLRGTFAIISVKERAAFLDDLRKTVRTIVAEATARDVDTDQWEETTP
jgi:hypothetical protein